jgi:hypothetical protein
MEGAVKAGLEVAQQGVDPTELRQVGWMLPPGDNGLVVFAFLQTIVMNLLRRGGYRSIRQGIQELAYDIQGMLALGGVATRASSA